MLFRSTVTNDKQAAMAEAVGAGQEIAAATQLLREAMAHLSAAGLEYRPASEQNRVILNCRTPQNASYNAAALRGLAINAPVGAPMVSVVDTEQQVREFNDRGRRAVSIENRTFEESVIEANRILDELTGSAEKTFIYTLQDLGRDTIEGIRVIKYDGTDLGLWLRGIYTLIGVTAQNAEALEQAIKALEAVLGLQ